MSYLRCPICGAPFQSCGPDHMTLPPIDIGGASMAPKVGPTREYKYMRGNMEMTAMLTEEQAERLNAEPVEGSNEDDSAADQSDVTDKARRTRGTKR